MTGFPGGGTSEVMIGIRHDTNAPARIDYRLYVPGDGEGRNLTHSARNGQRGLESAASALRNPASRSRCGDEGPNERGAVGVRALRTQSQCDCAMLFLGIDYGRRKLCVRHYEFNGLGGLSPSSRYNDSRTVRDFHCKQGDLFLV